MRWHDLWFERDSGRLRCWWRALAFLVMASLSASMMLLMLWWPFSSAFAASHQMSHVVALLLMLLLLCAVLSSSILTGIWAVKALDHLPAYTLGLSLREAWHVLLGGGFLAGLAAVGLLMGVLYLMGGASFSIHMMTPAEWTLFALVSVMVFIGAAAFETLVHGYLFQTLARGGGPIMALLLTAIPAILLTLPANGATTLIGPANLLVLCCVLGMLYLRSGSLWAPIGLLAGWCYGLFMLHLPAVCIQPGIATPMRAQVQTMTWFTDAGYGPCGGIIASAILLGALAMLAYSRRGLPLESHWWNWQEFNPTDQQPAAWDFSVGARYYQWKLLVRDQDA